MHDAENTTKRQRSWFQFSLRTLMLVALLIAVYLGGRYGHLSSSPPDLGGQWQAVLPAGFKRPVSFKTLDDNRFVFSSGASVFNGVYEWHDGNLAIVEPSDARMSGLVWKWDGEQFVLIAEPTGTPTGSSYLGTTLAAVSSNED